MTPCAAPPLTPLRRRLLYVTAYELFGVLLAGSALALMSGAGLTDTGVFAVASSAIAMSWNFLFNTLFEAWERRQVPRGRNFRRRLGHALGFELGLLLLLVPFLAWWLNLTLLEALLYDIGLALFFLVYTFLFNLGFDHLFGLPESARPQPHSISAKAP